MATSYINNATTPRRLDASASRMPAVRRIGLSDLHNALRLGWEDFKAVPSHAIMLCAIYPVLGLVLRSPSFGSMLGLGTMLLALFVVWVAVAQGIYIAHFGYEPAADVPNFVNRIFTTPQGWSLILVGCGVGFLFALGALCISAVSFPMMLDRHASIADAMLTSMRVVTKNPVTMAAWGLIVAGLLVVGSIPFFLGLAVVVPLLGHATWHLYREAVEPNPYPQSEVLPPPREHRSAADFPAALFPWQHK